MTCFEIFKQINKRLLLGLILLSLTLSFQMAYAVEASSEKLTLMGSETELVLAPRTKDPIRSGNRVIRVLVNYNATNYFLIEGKQAGLEYELMKSFESYLNRGLKAEKRHHLIFLSLPFDQLIPGLLEGKGDIIAAGMTITPERSKEVEFTTPYRTNISEILVRHKDTEELLTAAELAGKTVHILKGSSYFTHLKHLSNELVKEKKAAINIIEVDQNIVSEDLLQMVNAGIFKYVIVDSHIADLWSHTLNDIVIETAAAISTGSQIAWAIRKDNDDLAYKLNLFLRNFKQGTKLGNVLFNRYYKNTKWIENPVKDSVMKRLYEYQQSFMKYGKQYNIDWVMLTAQGYQESKLNQARKSNHGAVGVMQIKPSTAADKNVNIKGVAKSYDKNIHAATKYLAFIRSRYFSDPKIEPLEQLAFTLAAYNAGPRRISQMRAKARKLGKNPNKWFFNVENVTRRYVSSEPINYVANIMKYHLAFKSVIEAETARAKATEKIR